jgi:NAD(P) transhydrogenase subunit alpha
MSPQLPVLLVSLTVFILSVFLGIEVIGKVPTTLHTPLMSGTNAIHGIVVVAGMIVFGLSISNNQNLLTIIIAFVAIVFGAGNVVGGFVVTDRMLQMFRRKPSPQEKNKT